MTKHKQFKAEKPYSQPKTKIILTVVLSHKSPFLHYSQLEFVREKKNK